jgi:hypothetical protein
VLQRHHFVGDVGAPHVHLECGSADDDIGVIEELVEDVEDGGLGENQFVEDIGLEFMRIDVDRGQEDGLHLVVS